MKTITVTIEDEEKSIMDVPWVQLHAKAGIDIDRETFIRVELKNYADNEKDVFWEKEMTTAPMVS